MQISIVGLGFVGLSFASVLGSKGYSVVGVDTDLEKIKIISENRAPFFEPKLNSFLKNALSRSLKISPNIEYALKNSDIIFLTIGTPKSKDDYIDLSMLKKAAKDIGTCLKNIKKKPIIVIKSTVVPGTTNEIEKVITKASGKKSGKDFSILTNPEFLREGSAINDTLKPHLVVIGGHQIKSMEKLRSFYEKFYGKKVQIILTNSQTAEMIKYANNSFLATKISFINQISSLCQNIPGTNVDDIAKAIGIDPRIGSAFLKAGPGYGGSCLPKDLSTIIKFSSKIGADPILLKAVEKTNENQIEKILQIIYKKLGNLKDKQIGILGLSFKEDSDDVRESRSIKLIKILLKQKSKIKVHDPKAMNNAKLIFKNKITYSKSISDTINDTDCIIIMTPWREYTKLKNNDFKNMKKKLVIDTRRIFSKKKMNIDYIALGIGGD
ncbi:MAG: UDP-glucose/GDP-mannose dehydrogenase family protein [Bacteroidota bacterium]|nr:UDP-glucose/GDP-mannose dehydrogenase family protein [Bacteroidota bacterium]